MFDSKNNSIEKIGIKWGLVTFLLLAAYFLAMKATGLVHIFELRLLNLGFLIFGCYKAIKAAKSNLKNFNYFTGIGVSLLTALSASFLFAAFGFLYLTVLDPPFLLEIKTNEPLGLYLNTPLVVMQIFIEGSASGVFVSYALMQWLRVSKMKAEF